ncbi:glycosyltransferase family 4 protein [Sulfurospirillum sp. 1612]|uniref:glycosyltransferase family 4 protein n=1 Tax=Sulfurospirillum sp. 1612 TaxID=3094835 RepID=UPI002F957E83
MKICLIVDDYMPHSIKVAAKMMHELACEFINQGHEVTVITPSPELNKNTEITKLDDVTVCRFKSGAIKNVGKIKRAINETLLSYYAWKNFKSYFEDNRHDMIVYYSPSIFWSGLVKQLKKTWDAPSYLILRDLFPQWAVDQGLIRKGSIIEKYFRYFEKRNYAAANTIGLMSQKNLEWFKQTVATNVKLEVLYNWAANTPVESRNFYKKALKIEDKVVYFYGGNIGHAQDMMNIVRLAKNMNSHDKAHFVLVGAGDEVVLVRDAIEKSRLTNMTLLPSVGQDEFKQMLAEFDVGLFTLHKDHTTHNFPGKLLGYMVQKLPILGSINEGNDLKEIVEKYEAGLITINGDDETLLTNAIQLLDEDYRKKIGENAQELLKSTFSVEAAVRKII